MVMTAIVHATVEIDAQCRAALLHDSGEHVSSVVHLGFQFISSAFAGHVTPRVGDLIEGEETQPKRLVMTLERQK